VHGRRLAELLRSALAALPSSLRDRVVVFGSAPMVLAALKDDVNDLDLFVDDTAFEALLRAGFATVEASSEQPRVRLADDVEVFRTWPGVEFAEALAKSEPVPGSMGLRVAALEHVLASKLRMNRDKDQADIEAIRRALAR
jgi:hypothetical protein